MTIFGYELSHNEKLNGKNAESDRHKQYHTYN